MPRNAQQCAWAGCGKTTDKHSFGERRHIDAALQSPLLKPVPHSNVLCNAHGVAWWRNGQQQPCAAATTDGVAALLSAAAADESSSSFAPSSSSSLSRSLSSSPAAPSSSRCPPAPVTAPLCRTLSTITNKIGQQQRSPARRLSTTIKRKRDIVRALSAATTTAERQSAMARFDIDRRTVSRYQRAVTMRDSKAKGEREPLTARRLKGGGRRTVLTDEQEQQLERWVMDRREGPDHPAVSVKMLRGEARQRYGIKATAMWAAGCMQRRNLRLRLRTTTKEINTPRMQLIAQQFRCKYAPLFASHPAVLIFNVDETPVFLDAPSNRTIDRIGAKTIEIGTTKHEKDRVSVVICISMDGAVLDALIIHKCYEKTVFKKKNNIFPAQVTHSDGVTARMWVGYSAKAYMNRCIMLKWLDQIFMAYVNTIDARHSQLSSGAVSGRRRSVLLMDNMGAHDTEEVEADLKQRDIHAVLLPPNTTPILQPLDQAFNRTFKVHYEEEWAAWYHSTAGAHLTRHGNKKKASEEDVNRWVMAALRRVTPQLVRGCWHHSLLRPSLLTLPATVFARIMAYLPASRAAVDSHEHWSIAAQHRLSPTRTLPVRLNKKRKPAEQTGAAPAASAPKRRRATQARMPR
jgi:hypothetical protein